MLKIQGHRGSSEAYPENTMLSLREAYKEGADGIEMDVRRAADGVFILMHDASVDRTTNGGGLIERLSYGESLRLLDAGAWKSEAFARREDTRVPALIEALEEFKGTNVDLVLHLKCAEDDAVPLLRLVAERGMLEQAVFFGRPGAINRIKREERRARTQNDGAPGAEDYGPILDNAIAHGHDAVSVHPSVTPEMVERIRRHRKLVHCSFLYDDYEEQTRHLARLGVDVVLGNNVKRMRNGLELLD
ncbi:glycerophosphodiester phosphodiesterase [Paenibacillus thermotolerans]|uniref:glycerophosphodiester phosphodiesterase n=1 Tax=Paenibacillus thermotolerans TaxID=3027807 RepID=UPI0023684850|nr:MULTISPECIES: glycerophosphodiester phosphodiesterase family protein [unclassified Paenibacillus]